MTSISQATTGERATRSTHRAWRWCGVAAIVLAHVAKFPAMRQFIEANLHEGPDVSDLTPDLVQASLDVGATLGLALSAVISLLVFGIIGKYATQVTTGPGRQGLFPYWLFGIAVIGLTVPDLVSAVTGTVSVTSTPYHFAVYLPLAGAAILAAPPPPRRRLRVVDAALLLLLPFV